MSQLIVDGVSVEIEGRRLVDQVLLDVAPGQFVGLVGPNGSGKSSLLRTIYRVLKPSAGRIVHLGDEVWKVSARQAARRMAVVAQERMGEFDFTVDEIVMMGRTPHKRLLDTDTAADRELVERCLGQVAMRHCAGRLFQSLSGGEKQRVLVARALAQQAEFLVLDEPTNHLDIRHQLELLELIGRLGTTTLAALHDLNLAARYCDRLAMLCEGRLVAVGPPAEVLTAERISAVYGVEATVGEANGLLRIDFRLKQQ
jgi:iron complex transport system ATP-binding protein